MRDAFIDELVLQADKNPLIALVVGDLGYSVVEPFAKRFPKRFINAGVAEQNMTGLAAGLASEGFHVFTYSIANFPTFRCAEQIRNDIAYHGLPVTVVAVGGGLAYGALGYSHHAIQDYGLMRLFPEMLIAAPGDPMEVRACMRYLCENPQPSYLRLGKAGETSYHAQVPQVSPGQWLKVGKSKNALTKKIFLTTGTSLTTAINEVNTLQEFGDYDVYSLPIWGQGFKSIQDDQAKAFEKIVTIEDHLIDGGFGSWMMESLGVPENRLKIGIRALDPIVCGLVGHQKTLSHMGSLIRF